MKTTISTCRFSSCLTLLLAITFGLAATMTLKGALLVYEGFDYPVGDLSSTSGGVGFGTNIWSASTVGDTVVSGSLTYTDSLGNSLSNSGNRAYLTGSGGSSSPARVIAAARGVDGATTWISFLGVRHGADTIRVANLQIRTNTSERLAFGKATTNVTTSTWSLYHSGAAANSVFSTNAMDVTSFVVVRIDHLAGNDNAWMWVNPLLNAEPSTNNAAVAYLNLADYGFNGFRGFAGNAGSGGAFCDFEMDELRVGELFADVTPHPTAAPTVIPKWSKIAVSGNSVLLSLTGAVSTVYTVLASSDASTAVTNWSNLGTLTTDGTGAGSFTNNNALNNQAVRFYRARQ